MPFFCRQPRPSHFSSSSLRMFVTLKECGLAACDCLSNLLQVFAWKMLISKLRTLSFTICWCEKLVERVEASGIGIKFRLSCKSTLWLAILRYFSEKEKTFLSCRLRFNLFRFSSTHLLSCLSDLFDSCAPFLSEFIFGSFRSSFVNVSEK